MAKGHRAGRPLSRALDRRDGLDSAFIDAVRWMGRQRAIRSRRGFSWGRKLLEETPTCLNRDTAILLVDISTRGQARASHGYSANNLSEVRHCC
jgi:hypothetical protein